MFKINSEPYKNNEIHFKYFYIGRFKNGVRYSLQFELFNFGIEFECKKNPKKSYYLIFYLGKYMIFTKILKRRIGNETRY